MVAELSETPVSWFLIPDSWLPGVRWRKTQRRPRYGAASGSSPPEAAIFRLVIAASAATKQSSTRSPVWIASPGRSSPAASAGPFGWRWRA